MRLPSKVTISGKVYTVKRNPKKGTGYGRGNVLYRTIVVGSQGGHTESAFETYIHEITEVAMIENRLRYNRDGEEEFFYLMAHVEVNRLASDIAIAVRPMIKES